MKPLRHEAAGHLFSQHLADGIQIQRVGQVVAEAAQPLFIGALAAEENAVDQGL